jgi:hypothetical protein
LIETKTSISRVGKSGAAIVYIPSKIIADFLFPFELPSKVTVKVDGCKLIIASIEEVAN